LKFPHRRRARRTGTALSVAAGGSAAAAFLSGAAADHGTGRPAHRAGD